MEPIKTISAFLRRRSGKTATRAKTLPLLLVLLAATTSYARSHGKCDRIISSEEIAKNFTLPGDLTNLLGPYPEFEVFNADAPDSSPVYGTNMGVGRRSETFQFFNKKLWFRSTFEAFTSEREIESNWEFRKFHDLFTREFGQESSVVFDTVEKHSSNVLVSRTRKAWIWENPRGKVSIVGELEQFDELGTKSICRRIQAEIKRRRPSIGAKELQRLGDSTYWDLNDQFQDKLILRVSIWNAMAFSELTKALYDCIDNPRCPSGCIGNHSIRLQLDGTPSNLFPMGEGGTRSLEEIGGFSDTAIHGSVLTKTLKLDSTASLEFTRGVREPGLYEVGRRHCDRILHYPADSIPSAADVILAPEFHRRLRNYGDARINTFFAARAIKITKKAP